MKEVAETLLVLCIVSARGNGGGSVKMQICVLGNGMKVMALLERVSGSGFQHGSSSAAAAVQMAREDEEWRGAAMAAGVGRRRLNCGGRT